MRPLCQAASCQVRAFYQFQLVDSGIDICGRAVRFEGTPLLLCGKHAKPTRRHFAALVDNRLLSLDVIKETKV